jgi:hypothetical protein
VTAHELDGFFPAEHIDRVVLLQIADQREILVQNPTRSRIPARIDNEDAKARCGGRFLILLDGRGLCRGERGSGDVLLRPTEFRRGFPRPAHGADCHARTSLE